MTPATRDASPELFVLVTPLGQKSARLRTETYSQRPVSNPEEWKDGETQHRRFKSSDHGAGFI
ncbi:MAG: hypothetical protein FP824_02575 [Euryarchaeota archaeon]|nr:hypothetical protein [Euryarchaeota archaeon]